MSKIIEYFYIFSKLTTSIVLIVIIFVMGYALINSYNETDVISIDLESRYENLENLASINDKKLRKLDSKVSASEKKINEIKNILEEDIIEKNNSEYSHLIEKLLKQNEELEKEINRISLNLNQNENLIKLPKKNKTNEISSLVDLILIKYKNGENVKDEISYLNDILPNKKIILEKLNLIFLNKFYGFKNLKQEFNDSTKNYINFKFVNNQNSVFLDFLFKFVDIKPSNLTIFENEELNLIMSAKKLMEKEDIENSLKKIMKIENHTSFYSKWIEQSQLYLEFKNEIKKVI